MHMVKCISMNWHFDGFDKKKKLKILLIRLTSNIKI